MPLIELGLGPTMTRGQDFRPDYPFEGGVVRDDRQTGEHMGPEILGNAVTGMPDADRTVANGVARHPNLRLTPIGIDKRAHFLEIGDRPGLEIDHEAMLDEIPDFGT